MNVLRRLMKADGLVITAVVALVSAVIVAACSNQAGGTLVSPSSVASRGGLFDKPGELSCPLILGPDDAIPQGKITYCHIAGHAVGDNANEITLSTSAEGYLGHFDKQGNTLAGHELDHCGPCEGATPTPTPTPSPSPTGTP
jgi:hypothetical protein